MSIRNLKFVLISNKSVENRPSGSLFSAPVIVIFWLKRLYRWQTNVEKLFARWVIYPCRRSMSPSISWRFQGCFFFFFFKAKRKTTDVLFSVNVNRTCFRRSRLSSLAIVTNSFANNMFVSVVRSLVHCVLSLRIRYSRWNGLSIAGQSGGRHPCRRMDGRPHAGNHYTKVIHCLKNIHYFIDHWLF